ncbi:MAG: HAMP domain-containing histidine kinase [Lachnospiraceae bacterium]|nr:HAMP domain-containing histidine kinase [Lachnospiraceae bacterium]
MKWFRSIGGKIATLVLGSVVGAVLLLLIFNTFFLENYYIKSKSSSLVKTYGVIEGYLEDYNDGRIDRDTFQQKVSAYCENVAASAIIQRSDWGIAMTTQGGAEALKRRMVDIVLGNDADGEILKKNSRFTLQKAHDSRSDNDYLEIYGFLNEGDTLLVRISIESIRDNVGVLNGFIIRVGFIICALDVIISLFLARRISKPIKKLSKIADRMGDMDFSQRYAEHTHDEVDILGANFNALADKLEKTICDYKNANNELTNELDKAKRFEESRLDFVGAVSHELKTPIALIGGYAEAIRDHVGGPDKTAEYCDIIIDESNKMADMVRQLLSLNQIEAGDGQIDIEQFDVSDMADGIIEAKKLLTEDKSITIINSIGKPCSVYADSMLIEEVLTNYLTNAINHCLPHGVITIRAERMADDVRIYVKNTGDNIPEESMDKIWDKFYKVDKARTRAYGGNGIGLSIVKAIMVAHNKSYGVYNLPDGVEFYIDLDAKA